MARTRTLISITDWDLRWQHVYRFETPVPLPKGTTVSMRYVYDNSAGNPRNPAQPPKHVSWGQQSTGRDGRFVAAGADEERGRSAVAAIAVRAKMMAADVIGDRIAHPARAQPRAHCATTSRCCTWRSIVRPMRSRTSKPSLKLKPDSASAHFNYGTALAGAGRLDEAVAAYRAGAASSGRTTRWPTTTWELRSLRAWDKPAEADREFREAIGLDPASSPRRISIWRPAARQRTGSREAVAEFRERACGLGAGLG